MFMVSAPSPMVNNLGLLHHHVCRRDLKLKLDQTNETHNDDQLKKLSTASTGSMGGLRRTVSSLQSMKTCVFDSANADKCIVKARQIELCFTTTTEKPFILRVIAPNGETSERFAFPFGKTARFSPRMDGCGHGDWTFIIETIDAADQQPKSKKIDAPVLRTQVNLEGVGSLYYTIDDQMQIKLKDQEWIRLPSAASACRNSQSC
ncbi:hypothetical protein M3Y94_00118700 [Aphelenchoides besseyi]|nr:hypothetical protein M3Y94_00118700 [Aphelenchoides besseyi]